MPAARNVSSLKEHAQEREALMRELASERKKQHSLWRDRERLQAQADNRAAESVRHQRLAAEAQKACAVAERTAHGLAEQLQEAQQAAKQANQARRSLEHAAGRQGALPVAELVAKHARLKASLRSSVEEIERQKGLLQQARVSDTRLRGEVALLLRALEVRTQDLGLAPEGDPSSSSSFPGDGGGGGNRNRNNYANDYNNDGDGDGSGGGGYGGGHGRSAADQWSPASRARAVRSSLLYQLAHAQQEVETMRREQETLQQQRSQLQVDHASLLTRYESEQSARRAAEQERDQALTRLSAVEAKALKLETASQDLEANYATSLEKVEQLAEKLARADASVADLSQRCRSAEATLAEEQQARADQARDLGTQVDALARRAQQRSTVTDMAQEKLGEERKLRAQAEAELAQSRKTVQTLEQSLAGQAPELARVTALATSCQEENASLTHSLEIAQAVRGKLEAESKEKTQKLQNTEASLMACESALKELQEVHQSLQAECREAKEQCSAYQTDAQRSGSTVAELRAAVDQLAHSKQVLQAAMLQQLAHARAEARQSQAQLEEANARAAAAAVAASSGPLTRAKNAEMAAKQTLEAAGKRLARHTEGDSTIVNDAPFANGAHGMHTPSVSNSVRVSAGVNQASSSDEVLKDRGPHAPSASYSQEEGRLSPYRSRMRRAAALRAGHSSTTSNYDGYSGRSSSGGGGGGGGLGGSHFEKGPSHVSHYRAVAQTWAPSFGSSSDSVSVENKRAPSSSSSRYFSPPPVPPPAAMATTTTTTSADALFERRLQAARAGAAGAAGDITGTSGAAQGPSPPRSEKEMIGMALLSSVLASSSADSSMAVATPEAGGATKGVTAEADHVSLGKQCPSLVFVLPPPDPTAVRSSLAESLVQGHKATSAATGANTAPRSSAVFGNSSVQHSTWSQNNTSVNTTASAPPMQSQQPLPGSSMELPVRTGAGLFVGGFSSSSSGSTSPPPPYEGGGFSLAELAASDSF